MVKSTLEKDLEKIQKKYSNINSTVQKQKKLINTLQDSLRYEKFKNSLYKEIIKKFTALDIDSIIEEKESELHINDNKELSISIFLHNNEHTEKIKFMKREITGKETEESPDHQEKKIKLIEEKNQEVIKENFDVPYNSTIEKINKCFQDISTSKSHKKLLTEIMKLRSKLLGKISVETYIDLIKEHLQKLLEILKVKFPDKKIQDSTDIFLTPLEQRLIYYKGYHKKHLDMDEVNRFILALNVNMNYSKRFIPFTLFDFFTKLFNYSIVILPLKENLTRILVNPCTFNSIVYILDKNENEEKTVCNDPFHFYILDSISDDTKRHWKMDCRLDDFCRKTNDKLKEYYRETFRKMYFDIFSDNDYRENYKNFPLTTQDMQQLLINYLTLSKYKSYCIMIQSIVTDHCQYKPTKADKLNIKSDDTISKKNFQELQDSDILIKENFSQLFDNISETDLEKFLFSVRQSSSIFE